MLCFIVGVTVIIIFRLSAQRNSFLILWFPNNINRLLSAQRSENIKIKKAELNMLPIILTVFFNVLARINAQKTKVMKCNRNYATYL